MKVKNKIFFISSHLISSHPSQCVVTSINYSNVSVTIHEYKNVRVTNRGYIKTCDNSRVHNIVKPHHYMISLNTFPSCNRSTHHHHHHHHHHLFFLGSHLPYLQYRLSQVQEYHLSEVLSFP